jgi:hypothetical protein
LGWQKKIEGFGGLGRIIEAVERKRAKTIENMIKTMKHLTASILAISILGVAIVGLAADKKTAKANEKITPYTLKTCVVSGDKLGEMGKPFVFTNDTREIKLCCKSCLKDFKKEPAKFVKKIEEAEAKEKK